ncbi:MAG TPA: hypothetical protein VE397_16105 [Stellaceae bacterium]|nr:hypothetical protein [Stellaceae bacterium]
MIEAPCIAPAGGEVACVADEGCSYLRALSTIEHIAGFEHTARSYAAAASRCREQGCWAARKQDGEAAVTPPPPIPFQAVYRPSPRPAAFGHEAITVPFRRSDLIDVTADASGNCVEQRRLDVASLPARDDSLGSLYRYWSDLRAAGACRFSNIDTVQLARAGIIGKLHIVDVRSSDPRDFRFELFGYDVSIGRYYESPRAHPVGIWSDRLMRDYNTARLTGAPRLHRVRCRLGDTGHHFTRLILPFLDKRGRVTRLLVAIRQEPGDNVKVQPRR